MKFRIPATSANIGSGFDALGIALSMYNEVDIEESDDLQITQQGYNVIINCYGQLVFAAVYNLQFTPHLVLVA